MPFNRSVDLDGFTIFGNFYWTNGLPFWGEDVPGMDKFMEAFKAHGGDQRPDFYVLASYLQGLIQSEAVKRALEAGDLMREGFIKQIQAMKGWNAGGMFQPEDLTVRPYSVSNKTRILKPDFEKKSWTGPVKASAGSVRTFIFRFKAVMMAF